MSAPEMTAGAAIRLALETQARIEAALEKLSRKPSDIQMSRWLLEDCRQILTRDLQMEIRRSSGRRTDISIDSAVLLLRQHLPELRRIQAKLTDSRTARRVLGGALVTVTSLLETPPFVTRMPDRDGGRS